MLTIKEYCLLTASDNGALSDSVNQAIQKGWQPFGSPFCILDSVKYYSQAVVMYAPAHANHTW